MRLSIETASSIANVANIVLLASLGLGAASTGVIVWMSNVKEHFWDLDRREGARHVAQLGVDLANANARAEADRLARVKIEQKIAPRVLNPKALQDLTAAALANSPLPIEVLVDPSTETTNLGLQIAIALQAGSWPTAIHKWSGASLGPNVICAVKPGSSPDVFSAAQAVSDVLNSAGISSKVEQWPGRWDQFAGMLTGGAFNAGDTSFRVVVGEKD